MHAQSVCSSTCCFYLAIASYVYFLSTQLCRIAILSSSSSSTEHLHHCTTVVVIYFKVLLYFFDVRFCVITMQKYSLMCQMTMIVCRQPEHIEYESFSAKDKSHKGTYVHQGVSVKHIVNFAWYPALWYVQCIN